MSLSINIAKMMWSMLPITLAAGTVAIGIEYLKVKIDRKLIKKFGESSEERIDRLAKSLKEAASLSSEIETEIIRRHQLVEKLKGDVDRYDELSKLKGSEVEAIAQTIRGEIQREGNKSFLKSALINLVFFVAGAVVTVYMA